MIHVNLDEIVDAIESIEDEETAYLDPQTGKIQYTGSDDENMDERSDDWIALPDKYERGDYHNMELFIEQVEDGEAGDWLENAIRGKGAFRRFRAAADKFHLLQDWSDFEALQHKKLAIAWCEENGIIYDSTASGEQDEDEEDSYDDDFDEEYDEEEEQAEAEPVRVPYHTVMVSENNVSNVLYVYDNFRKEVLGEKSDLDQSEDELHAMLEDGLELTAVSDRGRFIALSVVEKSRENLELKALYVMKDVRRNGAGALLLKKAEAEAEEEGLQCILHINPKNTSGLAFFAHMGWLQSPLLELVKAV